MQFKSHVLHGKTDKILSMAGRYAGEVAARLDRLPMTYGLWRLVVLISLGGAFEFYDLLMTAYVAPGLVAGGLFTAHPAGFFAVNGIGFFVFCTFAGMWLGSVGFGFVADRMGRRAMFTVSLVWYSLATAMMAFQHSAAGIDFWRFVAAIGVGLEQVTIDTLLPELVPPPKRGRAFALSQGIAFAAVPVVALLGWLLVPLHPFGLDGWRWVALIGASGALFAWWLRLGVPESPRWLALHGREDEAEQVLRRLETRAEADIGRALPVVEIMVEAAEEKGRFGELFQKPYAKRTVVMSVFNAMQTIAFYGFGSWVPTLLIAKGIHVTTSLQYAFLIALANPVGPLLAFTIADRIERKWQIVAAGVTTGIGIFFFARQDNAALVILFGVLVTLANNWLSFAFHGYQAEQFPTRIRARAVGFVYSWSRVSAALAGLLIGFFLREGGTMAVALFIGAAMTVMVLVIGFWGPHTLGRRLEEISR
jgi:putative MFS transporter